MFVADVARAEGERQAAAILAVNLGTNGKKSDIERAIRDLTKPRQEPKGLDDALKMIGNKSV